MIPFQVSVHPSGDCCQVRVDGISNAHWLLSRLCRDFVFKTFEPIRKEAGSSCCSFHVSYSASLTHAKFERLLASIPSVRLTMEPQHTGLNSNPDQETSLPDLQQTLRQRGVKHVQNGPGTTP